MKRSIYIYAMAIACVCFGMTCYGKESPRTCQKEVSENSYQARFTRYEWKTREERWSIEIYNDNTFIIHYYYLGHNLKRWAGTVESYSDGNRKKFVIKDGLDPENLILAGRRGSNRDTFYGYHDSNNKCYYLSWNQSDVNSRTNLQKATWDPYQ